MLTAKEARELVEDVKKTNADIVTTQTAAFLNDFKENSAKQVKDACADEKEETQLVVDFEKFDTEDNKVLVTRNRQKINTRVQTEIESYIKELGYTAEIKSESSTLQVTLRW